MSDHLLLLGCPNVTQKLYTSRSKFKNECTWWDLGCVLLLPFLRDLHVASRENVSFHNFPSTIYSIRE